MVRATRNSVPTCHDNLTSLTGASLAEMFQNVFTPREQWGSGETYSFGGLSAS